MWYIFVLGYGFSLVVGHYITKKNVDRLWKTIGSDDSINRNTWHPAFIGTIERVMYTSCVLLGWQNFIAVWLALKAVPQWRLWTECTKDLHGRAIFNIFLIGNALSVIYGVAGGLIVKWYVADEIITAIVVAVLLTLGGIASFVKS